MKHRQYFRKVRVLLFTAAVLSAIPFFVPIPPARAANKFPAQISTPPLIVTGDVAAVPKMPAAIHTAPLVAAGEATTPPKFPAAIIAPGIVVTGTAP